MRAVSITYPCPVVKCERVDVLIKWAAVSYLEGHIQSHVSLPSLILLGSYIHQAVNPEETSERTLILIVAHSYCCVL